MNSRARGEAMADADDGRDCTGGEGQAMRARLASAHRVRCLLARLPLWWVVRDRDLPSALAQSVALPAFFSRCRRDGAIRSG